MQSMRGHKYLWSIPEKPAQPLIEQAVAHQLSVPIMQTLVNRGMSNAESVQSFLFSSPERLVADPALLKDGLKAVERILQAQRAGEKILIAGDYDVDGITSSALMLRCLLPLNIQANFFLPHRVKDGYGLSVKTIEKAAQHGYKIVITVDNGITAFQPALRAKELGIDLIITDHHKPHAHLPEAYAIVNPHQSDCAYPYKMFAGVGVSFKLMSLLYQVLNKELPSKAYELLLLGTIADVVPLTGENRYWVSHGLKKINATESDAFSLLKQNGKISKSVIKSLDIGFSITPQINALGRLEDPRQAVQFLIGADAESMQKTASLLFELNQARKEIEKNVFQEVVARIESGAIDITKNKIIIAESDSWPPGIIGLVASRIVGKYYRPAIMLHKTASSISKGSCRSITEFNMFQALEKAQDLLEQFGGHAAAAGLSIRSERIGHLQERLDALFEEQFPTPLHPTIRLDAHLGLAEVTSKLMHDLQLLEPFGHQNEPPVFLIEHASLIQPPQLLKEAHVKCNLFSEGVIKPIIFFNRPELVQTLNERMDSPISFAAQVTENEWNGKRSVELVGVDINLEISPL